MSDTTTHNAPPRITWLQRLGQQPNPSILLTAIGCGVGSWVFTHWLPAAVAAALLVWLCWRNKGSQSGAAGLASNAPEAASWPQDQPVRAPAADDADGLVEQMLSQGRCALLLRPQILPNLSESQRRRAQELLDDAMAMVPEGVVHLAQPSAHTENEDGAPNGQLVKVQGAFVDRYPVSNAQYQHFVDAGGYEEMALWDPEIWAGVLDFVDTTGHPGPRYWANGHHDPATANHPVVGVSWYEAAAYARWTGKRLTSDPEWVKTASWPVPVPGGLPVQRRYPWGNTLDRERANVWGSGPDQLVSVQEFASGVSVGGVHQLVGNCWEWTSGNFGTWHRPDHGLILEMPMKGIRGGAFDTYFENQASCQFQSGESPIARRHNIGFRCAVGLCDLATGELVPADGDTVPPATQESLTEPACVDTAMPPQAAHAATDTPPEQEETTSPEEQVV